MGSKVSSEVASELRGSSRVSDTERKKKRKRKKRKVEGCLHPGCQEDKKKEAKNPIECQNFTATVTVWN